VSAQCQISLKFSFLRVVLILTVQLDLAVDYGRGLKCRLIYLLSEVSKFWGITFTCRLGTEVPGNHKTGLRLPFEESGRGENHGLHI
jgi:hypothetical protein